MTRGLQKCHRDFKCDGPCACGARGAVSLRAVLVPSDGARGHVLGVHLASCSSPDVDFESLAYTRRRESVAQQGQKASSEAHAPTQRGPCCRGPSAGAVGASPPKCVVSAPSRVCREARRRCCGAQRSQSRTGAVSVRLNPRAPRTDNRRQSRANRGESGPNFSEAGINRNECRASTSRCATCQSARPPA